MDVKDRDVLPRRRNPGTCKGSSISGDWSLGEHLTDGVLDRAKRPDIANHGHRTIRAKVGEAHSLQFGTRGTTSQRSFGQRAEAPVRVAPGDGGPTQHGKVSR